MHRLSGIVAALVVLLGTAHSSAQDRTLTVFAAASMKNALDDIDAAYTAKTGVKVTVSYAASSTLARQIEQGAPADIFISADTDWMDYAIGKRTISRIPPRARDAAPAIWPSGSRIRSCIRSRRRYRPSPSRP